MYNQHRRFSEISAAVTIFVIEFVILRAKLELLRMLTSPLAQSEGFHMTKNIATMETYGTGMARMS